MMQNPDNKLREYVLKKQQQRERARILRAQRRNQEYDTEDAAAQYPGNQYQKYQNQRKRIIGDPFASITNKENTTNCYQSRQAPVQVSSSYDNNYNKMRPQSMPRNQYQQQHPNNDEFNNKILSMMEVFKSEINALNQEVNELKLQNHELKQNMIQLQSVQNQQRRTSNAMPSIATNRVQQVKHIVSSSNSSYRSSMVCLHNFILSN